MNKIKILNFFTTFSGFVDNLGVGDQTTEVFAYLTGLEHSPIYYGVVLAHALLATYIQQLGQATQSNPAALASATEDGDYSLLGGSAGEISSSSLQDDYEKINQALVKASFISLLVIQAVQSIHQSKERHIEAVAISAPISIFILMSAFVRILANHYPRIKEGDSKFAKTLRFITSESSLQITRLANNAAIPVSIMVMYHELFSGNQTLPSSWYFSTVALTLVANLGIDRYQPQYKEHFDLFVNSLGSFFMMSSLAFDILVDVNNKQQFSLTPFLLITVISASLSVVLAYSKHKKLSASRETLASERFFLPATSSLSRRDVPDGGIELEPLSRA